MRRPDQGKKAQTPVGYSLDTGVSTGGPVTAVRGVVTRVTPWVDGTAWERLTAPPALQCVRYDAPWPWDPSKESREQHEAPRRGEVRIRDGDGVMVSWTVWWAYMGWRRNRGGVVLKGTWRCR